MTEWVTVTTASDVTEEILSAAESIYDGWYNNKSVDWISFLERLEGMELENGKRLDLGSDMSSGAILKIQSYIRKYAKG